MDKNNIIAKRFKYKSKYTLGYLNCEFFTIGDNYFYLYNAYHTWPPTTKYHG